MGGILNTIDVTERKALGCGIVAIAGAATHLLFFIRGEHDRQAFEWVKRAAYGTGALSLVLLYATNFNVIQALALTALFYPSYFAGLYTSIAVYRIFLHPLRNFPGPFWARLSNFYHSRSIQKSDNYLFMQTLHQKYGPIVRTGPGNLSVSDPNAIRVVLANESKCTKSPWYDKSLPVVNLHTVRDQKKHDNRRKVFSKAFSPSAMKDYDTRVVVHCEEFVRQMRRLAGQPFDASAWLKYFAFDVMGDLGLGKEFHMMTSEKNRWIPDLLETSMGTVGITTPIPWVAPILRKIPGAGKHAKAWLDFVGSQVQERVEKQVDRPDILSHLVAAFNESNKTKDDYQWLRGDTRLTIVGGSDTTAATLTFLFYHLAKDPSQVEKLRAELEPLLQGKSHLQQQDISKAKHLNGVIQEALRLHPAIPSGFPRTTPAEGVTISGTYIPGNTTVVLPVYTMHHDEVNYEKADEFIPERWYSRPEMIKNKDAFLTWNIGTNGCIGRALAVSEMRNLITHWVQNFKSVRFAPGEDGTQLVTRTKDHFTLGVTPLHLVFEKI
ncbi:cytochrome P450 [Coniochaeta sp. 2T2.1]|nr:cytochrome P450 [Coniochaeta sp. 2T2.1]